MFLAGIQKLTLLDYPGKVACTVFTAGCDLRCPFCHNASLALPERERDSMELGDLLAFLKKRRGILDGRGRHGRGAAHARRYCRRSQ